MLKSLQNGESDAIPESMYSLISVLSHRSNIVSAFSGFSLRILELASKSDSALFNEIYPELCRTLCDIPPLSLQRQPAIIHDTYARIQAFLGHLMQEKKESRFLPFFTPSDAQFSSALQGQLKIALARGSTDSILTNILSILKTAPDSEFDLSSVINYMSAVGIPRFIDAQILEPVTKVQTLRTRGTNE